MVFFTNTITYFKLVISPGKDNQFYPLPAQCLAQASRPEGQLTSPPPEFDLVPLEVGLVLYHFDKTL